MEKNRKFTNRQNANRNIVMTFLECQDMTESKGVQRKWWEYVK